MDGKGDCSIAFSYDWVYNHFFSIVSAAMFLFIVYLIIQNQGIFFKMIRLSLHDEQ